MEAHKEITSLNEVVDILARQMHGIDGRLDGIDGRLDSIEARLATTVTMDYLDDKLADLRGDMMQVVGMENDKLLTVVDLLHKKELVTTVERQTIRLAKPFPKR